MPMLLNVGGGSKAIAIPKLYDDWEQVILDIDANRNVDLACDARLLAEKFLPCSYDAVYCSHNLEHYYMHDVIKVLKGFMHVLADDGFAEIRVPDIGELIRKMAADNLDIEQDIYESTAGPITAHDMIYGYGSEIEKSGQDFYAHKTGFSRRSLARVLISSGFAEMYTSTPLSPLEIHAFAFKKPATGEWKAKLPLVEKFEIPGNFERANRRN